MIQTLNININKTSTSRINDQDINNVAFGKCFSDHMLVANYANGKWDTPTIMPYQNVDMSYSMSALHYGQAIFEGLKAYKTQEGKVQVFRPLENFKRLNRSAVRMCMPEITEEIFMSGLMELLKLDSAWVPGSDSGSLYIRPFMIATDEAVGVKPSETYRFVILTSPSGAYYTEPVKVLIETDYCRAVEGGVGFVKAAGNYGRSLYPTKLAQQKGYHQLIWTDGKTRTYLEESGTMNLMFVINNTIVTPALSDTILQGITRDSVLTTAKHLGYNVEERKISVNEIIEGLQNGSVQEAFGVGTAATIAPIILIGHKDKQYNLAAINDNSFSTKVGNLLKGIRKGHTQDTFNWMYSI